MRRADRIAQTGKQGRPLRLMSNIAPSSARWRAICMAFAQKLSNDVGNQQVVIAHEYAAPVPRTTVASHWLTYPFPPRTYHQHVTSAFPTILDMPLEPTKQDAG